MREIAFFDVEATAAGVTGRRCWLLEFGAILVCPKKLIEIGSYSTFIRPGDSSAISKRFDTTTHQAIASAPVFEDVADEIFEILDGRVWAGHNIRRFDCPRIREAFADIGRPAPEPIGTIDSLAVLSQEFGRRAGNLKMATLASYFDIGQQKHRSLDDCRMNLEVLKHCATVLLLESSLPEVLRTQDSGNVGVVTRRRATERSRMEKAIKKPPSPPPISSANQRITSQKRDSLGKVVERARYALRSASGTSPLNTLLRHSITLLR